MSFLHRRAGLSLIGEELSPTGGSCCSASKGVCRCGLNSGSQSWCLKTVILHVLVSPCFGTPDLNERVIDRLLQYLKTHWRAGKQPQHAGKGVTEKHRMPFGRLQFWGFQWMSQWEETPHLQGRPRTCWRVWSSQEELQIKFEMLSFPLTVQLFVYL